LARHKPAMTHDLVSALSRARVLVVGDVMVDVFVRGDVTRISPEAPVPVLMAHDESRVLGGAANVARNLVDLGAHICLVGVIGDDEAGGEALRLVEALGPNVDADLVVDPSRPTTRKHRFVSKMLATHLLRVDWEIASALTERPEARVINSALSMLDHCDVLVLSDYAKGVLTPRVCQTLIKAARAAGKAAIIDPKGADFSRYAGASLLMPNKGELAKAARIERLNSEAEIIAAAHQVLAETPADALLVTRGDEGASLISVDGVTRFAATARTVRDVSGAGDTVAACVAAALASGSSLVNAARVAMAAAGVVVEKPGTASVSALEAGAALARLDGSAASEKAVDSLDEALERIQAWRRQGLRIGFTNGCFDVLHAGHVSLLGQARTLCDRLVLGLNSDASVSRLKGPSRPINLLADRAAVLAGLEAVDLVVAFEDDTPLSLIEALRPDVLIKGADYRVDQVVGADLVGGYGGEIALIPLVEGRSTTGIVRKITLGTAP
jgi:D-beta-D-heptose 7-phosphate kinase / D-beta-D-heptose 1-phosphate adenosyltransferase